MKAHLAVGFAAAADAEASTAVKRSKMLESVPTVVRSPSHTVNAMPPALPSEELLQARIGPDSKSVYVNGKAAGLAVGVGVGLGEGRLVYPHWSALPVRSGRVVKKIPDEHWHSPPIPLSGSAKFSQSELGNADEVGLVTPALLALPVDEAELVVVKAEAPEPGVALLVAVELTAPML